MKHLVHVGCRYLFHLRQNSFHVFSFILAQQVLPSTVTQNGEGDVEVYSVIVHETDTGYAQSFIEDIENEQMGAFRFKPNCSFLEQVQAEWADTEMYDKLKEGIQFQNPTCRFASTNCEICNTGMIQ